IPDLQAFILGPSLEPVPVASRRALHRRPSLARGYLGRPGLTASASIPTPSAPRPESALQDGRQGALLR
ncbi:hypothetical protein ACLESO_60205, partial [Pyxidicoccus sp. 3LG]